MAKKPYVKKDKGLEPEQDVEKILDDVSQDEKPVRQLPEGDIKDHAKFHKFKKGND